MQQVKDQQSSMSIYVAIQLFWDTVQPLGKEIS